MSRLALALFFVLAAQGLTAQQNQAIPSKPKQDQPRQSVPWNFMSAPIPQFSLAQGNARRTLDVQKRLTEDEARRLAQKRLMGESPDCYALRVYTFNRQDGNAPVLASTTTCTPADIYRRKNAGRPPTPKLIPLSY